VYCKLSLTYFLFQPPRTAASVRKREKRKGREEEKS
jgi:hypothetical protein